MLSPRFAAASVYGRFSYVLYLNSWDFLHLEQLFKAFQQQQENSWTSCGVQTHSSGKRMHWSLHDNRLNSNIMLELLITQSLLIIGILRQQQ